MVTEHPKIKAIIFDLDGTLIDSYHDIGIAMNKALHSCGYKTFPVEDYKGFIGNGLHELILKVLPSTAQTKKKTEEITELFNKYYDLAWRDNTRLFPGMLYLIQMCISRRNKVAILSNKPHYFTKAMIRFFFRGKLINHTKNPFGIYSGEQKDKPLKPDPTIALELAERLKVKPEHIAFIGDTDVDIQTAKNAGMISIGAAWGYRSADELKKAGADYVFNTPTELATMLNTLPNCP
ncbi:MAG: HAD family hydrolase [Candidatus Cloacimonetes bacterium]|nr:HAD family hydrolase [Candidatus Cloacimonadota bacterium]